MAGETQPYKRSLAGSVGSGVKSIIGGSKKQYYIIEHKIGSKYHQAGEQQEIIVDQAEIGRDARCQVRFDEYFETVSRRHAAIVREGNHWKLVPISQVNPTLLNGQKVQKEWFLQHGDEIQCAVNGPKLGFIIPSGKKKTAGSISLSRRMNLFGKQVVLPYRRTIVILLCIILLTIAAGGGYFFFTQGKNTDPGTAISVSDDKNDDKRYDEDVKEKQSGLSESKASQSVPPANAETRPPVQPGGTTYAGSANIPDIGSFRITFILSADKKEISNITIAIEGLRYSVQHGNTVTNGSVGQLTSNFYTTHSVQSPTTDISLGNATLKGLTFTHEGAYAEVKYVFETDVSGHGRVLVPFTPARITFKVIK